MNPNSSVSDAIPAVRLRNSASYGSTIPASLTRSTEIPLEFVVSRSGSGGGDRGGEGEGSIRARVWESGGGGREESPGAKRRRRW
uniref:Uncharacterized protein n=1 Tax=Arundo donax TaxID=35708 RepID=A0A0A9CSX1_ARUDO